MRFGFVAASLTVHFAVVGLVWRFAPEGLPPSQTPTPASGLKSQEIEVTPWEDRTSLAATDPEARAADIVTPNRAEDDAESTPEVPSKVGLPTKSEPATQAPLPPAASPVRKPSPAAPLRKERENAPPDDGDWLSVAQQLPDFRETPPSKTQSSEPSRDALVERLLAKERDKQHVAARDEAERRARLRSENAARPVANSVSPDPKRSAELNSEEVFGESRARADLWVELTRWLPRAASGDGVWERLPVNSSYEFRVELTTEGGTVVDTKVVDRAPPAAKKLLTNTAHLMSRGRYGGTRRTVHQFELRIRLSSAEGRDLWIAHTTPDPPKPGVGSFIAPSGRRFDVWVSKLP